MAVKETNPSTFDEAIKSQKWREAMDVEIKSIGKNNTWDLTTLSKGVKPISVKWVYKTKYKENGQVDIFKGRLVAKGYVQQYRVDYTEVYVLVARLDYYTFDSCCSSSKRVDCVGCEECFPSRRAQRRNICATTIGI